MLENVQRKYVQFYQRLLVFSKFFIILRFLVLLNPLYASITIIDFEIIHNRMLLNKRIVVHDSIYMQVERRLSSSGVRTSLQLFRLS
ncbi:unnamed protein product [Schistosoma margrebowiei]|uniref:Uncharacterized protein n=1 Tax=Schistosoma margrebowiei TaxID=48269 RepID=A0A3P8DIT5_9TREM|nr:unnamed protein product [Schistosoma margrebowiei]